MCSVCKFISALIVRIKITDMLAAGYMLAALHCSQRQRFIIGTKFLFWKFRGTEVWGVAWPQFRKCRHTHRNGVVLNKRVCACEGGLNLSLYIPWRQMGCGGVTPLNLNVDIRWKWLVSLALRLLYAGEIVSVFFNRRPRRLSRHVDEAKSLAFTGSKNTIVDGILRPTHSME